MIDKSLLTKLCTIVRAVWRFIISVFRESYTKDNWCELSKFCSKIWEDKGVAYNSLAQDADKKKHIPLEKGTLSLPGGNSETGRIIRILLMASFLSMIIGGVFGAYLGGSTLGGLILIAIFILFLFIIPILNYQINTYSLGYLGERAVAEELDNLISQRDFSPQQWRFFHSFFPEETNKGDIDHVIVCPKGIFCVETKTWRKKNGKEDVVNFKNGVLTVNNSQHDKIVKQVEKNAQRMRRFLEEKGCEAGVVKSIITFPGWWHSSEDSPDATIFAINPKQFHHLFHYHLSKKTDTLNQEQIDKISQVIKDRDRTSLEQIEEILS